jgi:hypothetical protein
MSQLNLKPDAPGRISGDKQISVPALDHAGTVGAAARALHGAPAPRRRSGLASLAHPVDDGVRLFRVF